MMEILRWFFLAPPLGLLTVTFQQIYEHGDPNLKSIFLPVVFVVGSVTIWGCEAVKKMERQAALQSRELDPSSLMGLDDTDSEDDFHLLARMKARQNQEQKDRAESEQMLVEFLGPATVLQNLPDLGSRLQKRWYRVGEIISTPMAPRNFEYDATVMTNMNQVFHGLKHPHVLPVLSVAYKEVESGARFLVVSQWQQQLSLRDYLQGKCDPLREWENKYHADGGAPLTSDEVAFCGRQILEAMKYLYAQGFLELGCIHTGNIFVYENVQEHSKLVLEKEAHPQETNHQDEETTARDAVEEIFSEGEEFHDEVDLGYEVGASSEATSTHAGNSSNQSAKSAGSGSGEAKDVAKKILGISKTPSKLKVVSKKAKAAFSDVKTKSTSALDTVGKQVEKKPQLVRKGVDSAIKEMKLRLKPGASPMEGLTAIEEGGITGRLECRLGGYESILLGYKANRYQAISSAHMKDRIDLIMFGHVIYEMATGNFLPADVAFPNKEHYADISDDNIRRDLRIVFDTTLDEHGYIGAVNQILELETFRSVTPPMSFESAVELSSSLRQKLSAIFRRR